MASGDSLNEELRGFSRMSGTNTCPNSKKNTQAMRARYGFESLEHNHCDRCAEVMSFLEAGM